MGIQEVPDPSIIEPTDVLIRMAAVGVCGSDKHYYLEGRIGSQVVEYPFTIGHEGAGVVEAVGTGVTKVQPGDRIAIDPAMPCFACDQCLAGRSHTCRKLRFLGCPGQAEGCLSELLVMPETSCYPIPDSMSMDEAVVSEPMAIAVYAAKLAGRLGGAAVGILGAGPIGLCVLLACRAMGAARAYATDKVSERLAMAARLGAAWVGNPDENAVEAEVSQLEPALLDFVFECCGEQDALDQSLRLLKPGGKLLIVGIPAVDRVSFSIDLLRRKEICVQNVRRQNECCQPTLDMMARGDLDVKPMVTHRFPLSESQEAFEIASAYRDGVVKAIIEIA